MKCPKCDFTNPDDLKECQKCGVVFDKIIPAKSQDSQQEGVSEKESPRKTFEEMYQDDAEEAYGDMLLRYVLSAILFIIPVYLWISNGFDIKWYYIVLVVLSVCAFFLGEYIRLGLEDYDEKRKIREKEEAERYVKLSPNGRVQCSKCDSFSIITIPEAKDYGFIGGLLLAPILLLTGGFDPYLINLCQNCGHKMQFRENEKKK